MTAVTSTSAKRGLLPPAALLIILMMLSGQALAFDSDSDTICDDDLDVTGVCTAGPAGGDNCPLIPNTDQRNTDGAADGGDACDDDDDNDMICDGGIAIEGVCIAGPDNCRTIPNNGQADSNGNGCGDFCEFAGCGAAGCIDGVGSGNGSDGNSGTGGGGAVVENPGVIPLFDEGTPLEASVLELTDTALITRWGDRARDRHARENNFQAYDHYLKMYWEDRTASIVITDTVAQGGKTISFEIATEFRLEELEPTTAADMRFFYLGGGSNAEYHDNRRVTIVDNMSSPALYTHSVDRNAITGEDLQVGDHMEIEFSQFLHDDVIAKGGRANYYGTAIMYVVGVGIVPWQKNAPGPSDDICPCYDEFSLPIDEEGWLGGLTTLPYQYSDEPRDHFMQMAGNLSGDNAQPFVLGRRLVHTDFEDGKHNEDPENPVFEEQAGKLGPHYINESCDSCHVQNTRSLPPEVGTPLTQYVIKIGDEEGNPDPLLGGVFQPGSYTGDSEGTVSIKSWTQEGGLRSPNYEFSDVTPAAFSARAAPQLVGMGLLEAIPEAAIEALADIGDADGDGISGRMRVVTDPVSGDARLGRFGWKAGQATVQYHIAGALQTDMGVLTSIFSSPECGREQEDCGPEGAELSDTDLQDLTKYISLLGVSARRDLKDATALQGEDLFEEIGCADCHVTTFSTSDKASFAELRGQTIHPYTDLLLHDMGPGLADTLPEGDATGAEWRTAPLWNVGLTADVNAGEAYLHDGRARTLEEAIRWHGGEGENSRTAYEELAAGDQQALVAFLKSL